MNLCTYISEVAKVESTMKNVSNNKQTNEMVKEDNRKEGDRE